MKAIYIIRCEAQCLHALNLFSVHSRQVGTVQWQASICLPLLRVCLLPHSPSPRHLPTLSTHPPPAPTCPYRWRTAEWWRKMMNFNMRRTSAMRTRECRKPRQLHRHFPLQVHPSPPGHQDPLDWGSVRWSTLRRLTKCRPLWSFSHRRPQHLTPPQGRASARPLTDQWVPLPL